MRWPSAAFTASQKLVGRLLRCLGFSLQANRKTREGARPDVVLRGELLPFRDQESISSVAQRGVVMKAAPTSSLIVTKPQFLLEVLVVALDPPAQLGGVHQGAATDVGRQRRQPVLRRFGFIRRPFDQAPFLGAWCSTLIIAICRSDAHGGEARGKPGVAALAPSSPAARPFSVGQVPVVWPRPAGAPRAADGARRTATPAPRFRRQRFHARRPQAGGGLDGDDIGQADLGDAVTQIGVVAVASVEQRHLASIPAARVARSCSSAICCLVRKTTSSGTPASVRRAGSSAHSRGR